jgi:UDP-N-acetylmuramoyl-L-alanyl-D-glutamate--2,6-diaminopimelate ligase
VRGLANAVGAQVRTVGSGSPDSDRSVISRTRVTGVTLRSGDVRPGDLFAAIRGSARHGAAAIPEALDNGAVAILTDPEGVQIAADLDLRGPIPVLVVEAPRKVVGTVAAEIYGRPSDRLLVIGLTGTSGKTTTSYLVEAGLVGCGLRTGVIGTVETRIGSEVLPSALTTPEAPDLQALLQLMLERGVQAVAMEVSSHALAMDRVGATRFAVGAFTNLSHDHLDFHVDIEDYFEAKALLFDGRADAGVVDIDGPYGRRLKQRHPELVTVSAFGTTDGMTADWTIDEIQIGAAGITNFTVRTPRDELIPVALELPGSFNIANALLALACIDAAGLDARLAAPMLAGVVVPGRMQSVDCGQDFLAVVDYAHKPGALDAILAAIRPDTSGRIILVIGAGGDRDTSKRPMMGEAAARGADLVIVTDDNPRSEEPAAIRAEILAGVPRTDRGRVREIGDRGEAIRAAVQAARAGDAVVIAGKGHEQGQQVGNQVLPFADVDELSDALHEALAAARASR